MARYVYVLALFIYIIDILLYLSSSITSSSYNFTFVCRLLHYFPLREFFAHGGGVVHTAPTDSSTLHSAGCPSS